MAASWTEPELAAMIVGGSISLFTCVSRKNRRGCQPPRGRLR
jgi:hypothetical protein